MNASMKKSLLAIVVVFLLTGVSDSWPAMGGTPPNVIGAYSNPGRVVSGGTAVLSVAATPASGSSITKYVWTTTAGSGTFPGGLISYTVADPNDNTVVWTAPSAEAEYTITVRAYGPGTFGDVSSLPATVKVNVVASNQGPVIGSLNVVPNTVLVGGVASLQTSATDPEGDAMTYAFTATAGTITEPDVSTPAEVSWSVPGVAGNYFVFVNVSDGNGVASSTAKKVAVDFAVYTNTFADGLKSPVRLASDAAGNVYVADAKRKSIMIYTPNGALRQEIAGGSDPVGIAVAADGRIFVSNVSKGAVEVLAPNGTHVAYFGSGEGQFGYASDIQIDSGNGDVYIADGGARKVYICDSSYSVKSSFAVTGTPAGIWGNAAAGFILVSDIQTSTIKKYDLAGALLATYGGLGANPGQFTQIQGIDRDAAGYIYAVDVFQGNVVILNSSGVFVDSIGSYGAMDGGLVNPKDVLIDKFGRVLVASGGTGRIEVFSSPVSGRPDCVGDSDCDGMPDSWEIAYGLDPFNNLDAVMDADGDKLSNIEEYLRGTNPNIADTDGDGVSDFDEVAGGTDPLNPNDNKPKAKISDGDIKTLPGLVTISGLGSSDPNGDTLTYAWSQTNGSRARFLGAPTGTMSVLLNRAGIYEFDLSVGDGSGQSDTAAVTVEVIDVAPQADAGPDRIANVGSYFTISGLGSYDANEDYYTCSWRILSGPPTSLENWNDCEASLNISEPGVVTLELTAMSEDGQSTTDTVNIIAQNLANTIPVANAGHDIEATVGGIVMLDGSGSFDSETETLTYKWTQVWGRDKVDLTGASTADPRFAPKQAGVYKFSLVVSDGTAGSVPDEVTVVAHPQNGNLPYAEAGYDMTVSVGDVVHLNGSRSIDFEGNEIKYGWVQIAGPTIAVFDTHSAYPYFVAPIAGIYVFELSVSDDSGTGLSDTVTVVVNDIGDSIPEVSDAGKISGAVETALTVLDPTEIDADGNDLTSLWVQVSGPSVYAEGDPLVLSPIKPGIYVFEKTVFDGRHYSLPAKTILVATALNEAPPLAVTYDQLAVAGNNVALDATGSIDPQGAPLDYYWSQTGGPRVSIADPNQMVPTFITELAGYTYSFELSVSNPPLSSLPAKSLIHVVDVPGDIKAVDADGGLQLQIDGLPQTYLANAALEMPAGAAAAGTNVAVGLVWETPVADGYLIPAGMLFVGPEALKLKTPATLTVEIPAEIRARTGDAEFVALFQDPYSGQAKELPATYEEGQLKVTVDTFGRIAPAVKGNADPPTGGGTGGGDATGNCFIATAAYGEYDAPKVRMFRQFRDQVLGQFSLGRRFIHGYYRISPPIAEAVKNHPALRAIVRAAFIPMSAVTWVFLDASVYQRLALLFAMLAAVGFLMRRRAAQVAVVETKYKRSSQAIKLLVVLLFVSPAILLALDPPHDSSKSVDCRSCHTGHSAPGMTLTKIAGNANLCLSCHTPGNPMTKYTAIENADQATPGTSGKHHRWDAAVVNATYGSQLPSSVTYPDIYTRLENPTGTAKLMCSTCHDQHTHDVRSSGTLVEARNPFSPTAPAAPPSGTSPAGRKFMRWKNDANEMCRACHVPFANATSTKTYDGTSKSHPTAIAYPGADPTFFPAPRESNGNAQTGTRYASNGTGDTNLSNNYILDINNQINCMTCHGVHNADSNETTDDGTW